MSGRSPNRRVRSRIQCRRAKRDRAMRRRAMRRRARRDQVRADRRFVRDQVRAMYYLDERFFPKEFLRTRIIFRT